MQGYGASSYGDAFADVYDEWYADLGDVDATVARIRELAGPGRVLELAVGTGRIAIPLAATGLEVHGIDSSRAMLDRLASKPGGTAVTAHLGDMAAELPAGPFGVVLVTFNSLFNLDAAGQSACVANVARVLEPGGRFVVEAFVPDPDRADGATVGVRSLSARHVVLSVDVHTRSEQKAEGQFVEITETGGVRLRPWSIRYSTPEQLDAMASAAGLDREVRWEDWIGTPFGDDSARHVTVYRRPLAPT